MIAESGKIEHDAFEKFLANKGRKRDDRPSDHRPVTAQFKVS